MTCVQLPILRSPGATAAHVSAIVATLAGCIVLGGCTVGPDYAPPGAAMLAIPAHYSVGVAPVAPVDLAVWWTQFDDPLLTDLIARATAGNLAIAVSQARLRAAREALIQSNATLLPTLTGTANAARNGQTVGGTTIAANTLSLGLDAAWQADVFGGNRRGIQSSRATMQSAAFRLAGVRTAVAGEVTTNYIAARRAQAQLAIARDTLTTQDDNLNIAGWRVQAGLASSLDQEQARAQRATTAATVPTLETIVVNAANRLAVLTGQAPGALRAALEAPGMIPHGPDGVAVGVPLNTLRQRPDVRAAERDLAAATAQIGIAEAQLYPALTISGTLNAQGSHFTGLTDLVTSTLFAGLTQTIFAGGRLRSAVRSARDTSDAAFATYKSTVLTGLEDVENAMQALTAAQQRQALLAEARDASGKAAILARSQYRSGLTDFVTVLQSEQSLLSARDALAAAQADRATALVQLYLALGGGWQPDDATANGMSR